MDKTTIALTLSLSLIVAGAAYSEDSITNPDSSGRNVAERDDGVRTPPQDGAMQPPPDSSGRVVAEPDDLTDRDETTGRRDTVGPATKNDGSALTPMDQSGAPEDVALTQSIRKEVVADDDLSMMAHNVKIITINGVVTLRGSVRSESEKQQIAAVAERVAGTGKVQNHLEIAK
jgi:hyperosmotically inducible protein